MLLYYDSENSGKPIGVIFLEGCFCERVLNPVTGNTVGSGGNAGNNKSEKLHCTTDKMVRFFFECVCTYLIPIWDELGLEFDFWVFNWKHNFWCLKIISGFEVPYP